MGGQVQGPILGRFLSADPTVPYPESSQSFNRYSYGQNNPTSRVDPSGFTDRGFSLDEGRQGNGGFVWIYTIRGDLLVRSTLNGPPREPTNEELRRELSAAANSQPGANPWDVPQPYASNSEIEYFPPTTERVLSRIFGGFGDRSFGAQIIIVGGVITQADTPVPGPADLGGAVVIGVGLVILGTDSLWETAMNAVAGDDDASAPSPESDNTEDDAVEPKSFEDIIDDSTRGRDTKGRSKLFDRPGGFDQANDDFDSLQPTDVRPIETEHGPGRMGALPNGRKVVVRPGSSDGARPTLEVQTGKRKTKIRYGE